MKRTGVCIALAVLLAGCGSSSAPAKTPDALDQMAAVFDGAYSRTQIQTALDRALAATGDTPSEDTYSRAGSALVALSNKLDVPEMDILECIPSYAGTGLNFAEAAAYCGTELSLA